MRSRGSENGARPRHCRRARLPVGTGCGDPVSEPAWELCFSDGVTPAKPECARAKERVWAALVAAASGAHNPRESLLVCLPECDKDLLEALGWCPRSRSTCEPSPLPGDCFSCALNFLGDLTRLNLREDALQRRLRHGTVNPEFAQHGSPLLPEFGAKLFGGLLDSLALLCVDAGRLREPVAQVKWAVVHESDRIVDLDRPASGHLHKFGCRGVEKGTVFIASSPRATLHLELSNGPGRRGVKVSSGRRVRRDGRVGPLVIPARGCNVPIVAREPHGLA